MPEASIVFGGYFRTGNPDLVDLNCYVEQVPNPSGPRLQLRQRPGLENFNTVGTGPLRGVCQKDGIFGGASLIVSGSQAFLLDSTGSLTTLAGVTIGGNGLVSIDLGQDSNLDSTARIATGEGLYLVSLGLVVRETFPVAAGAICVCYHRQFWFAVATGTQQAYFQVPGDTAWTPLSFASAEYSPDPLIGIVSRGDQFALLGSSSFEPWALTGSASPAIAPYGGLNADFGCRALATAVNCKGSLLWVDNECNVRRWDGGVANIVSGPGLAEQIRQVSANDLRAWTFQVDGHRFYVLTIGASVTWAFDLLGSGSQWTTFGSLGLDYWLAHLGTTMGDITIALDNVSAKVYRLDPSRKTDGTTAVPVICTVIVEGQDRSIPCSNVVLHLDVGKGPYTGQGSAPVASESHSDDDGNTFSGWDEQPLPVAGSYGRLPRWNGLGDIPPLLGRIFRFAISDPVGVVIKRVWLNVP